MLILDNLDQPIGLASDHAGYKTKCFVLKVLEDMGLKYKDFGAYSDESSDYPDYAHPMASAVENDECSFGIAICGTGNGINMTMNKHQGIRAALCWNTEVTYYARAHNDANVLSLPGRLLTNDEFVEIRIIFIRQRAERFH